MEYTDKELLNLLYSIWTKNGKVKREDFRPIKNLPHYQVFSKRFGSWENAKELAGINQNNRKRKSLSKYQIIEEFKNVCSGLKKVPSITKFVEISNKVGVDRIYKLFGEYEALIQDAGIEASKYKASYKKRISYIRD